jgi:hypothetical protein
MTRVKLSIFFLIVAINGMHFFNICAHAIEIKIVETHMIVTGAIVKGDGWTFKRAISNNPQVDTLVLRNMLGGLIEEMEPMRNAVEERRLRTVVSGRCLSACATVFMAGEMRQFAADFHPYYSYLGFHGVYSGEGPLKGFAGEPVTNEDLWYIKRSGGKLDRELVQRWMRLGYRAGIAKFFYQSPSEIRSAPSFICATSMPIEQCEKLDKSALDLGLITSSELAHVNDQPDFDLDQVHYWKPELYKNVEPVSVLFQGNLLNEARKKVVESYLKIKVSKVLVTAGPGKVLGYESGDDGYASNILRAISMCQEKSQAKCYIIGIDDHLTLSIDAIKSGNAANHQLNGLN